MITSSFPYSHVHSNKKGMMFKITVLNEFGNNFSLTLSFSWISSNFGQADQQSCLVIWFTQALAGLQSKDKAHTVLKIKP